MNIRRIETMNAACCLWTAMLTQVVWTAAMAEQRQENFDKDPGWDGHNNRSVKPETIRQDFGWSSDTTNAGGTAGEIEPDRLAGRRQGAMGERQAQGFTDNL